MKWMNTPQTLTELKKGKDLGVNSFIVEFSPDRYPPIQEGLFYLKKWYSIEELIVKWLSIDHDIVLLFSAKDNIKFFDVGMERKFKNLMSGTTTYNPNDKYSRLSGSKLFELPKDNNIESCNVVSRALLQQKLKIAIVIERSEVFLSNTSYDPRVIDSVKAWIFDIRCHTLVLLTDNEDNIYHDIRRMSPPLVMHLKWKPPTKDEFEKLFICLKIVKPYLFKESEPAKLASACEGIHYAQLEALLNKLEETKEGSLSEALLKEISEEARNQALSNGVGSCFVIEKPGVTFDQVIGLDSVIERIRTNFIYPDKYPELFKNRRLKRKQTFLLHGPPGNGKTLLGKATATELNAVFLNATVGMIKSKFVGVAENTIRDLFALARRYSRCILFFDEIDAIIPRRDGDDNGHMNGTVAQFLAEMDGLVTHKKGMLLVIGATNKPQNIDSAALRPGRFDYKILVPLPNMEARKKMFYLYLNSSLIDNIDYGALADCTEGYSGADISHICEKTESNLFSEDIKKGHSHPITTNLILKTINSTAPSVSMEEMKWFREYDQQSNMRLV